LGQLIRKIIHGQRWVSLRKNVKQRSADLIEIGAGSVPAVYQILSVKQKSKVIFVPRFFF
ncbi:hypothetical protein CUS76_04720, partial [Enterococcus faecalis]